MVAQKIFQASQHIACYISFRNEIDPHPLIEKIWEAKKQCYLPALDENKILHFIRYEKDDLLYPNQFGILEPDTTKPRISREQLDLVITPLIAFDRKGNRLGTGGGYYDKTFFYVGKKPVLIGYAYSIQEAEKLPNESWDIKLDGIATEKGFIAPPSP